MNIHRIHRVAKLTGLSKDVIRIWERRFGLLRPVRGPNRYRNYSDEDVALLRYLKAQVDQGTSIGELAAVGRETLLERMKASLRAPAFVEAPLENLLQDLIAALDPFDRVTFEKRLNGAIGIIPFEEALSRILLPLQQRVGQLWHDGRVSVAIEHYVTRQVQQRIFSAMNQLPVADFGPKIVVACPPEEEHDIAALAVAYRCRVRGCRVYYLGANVPIASLTNLCRRVEPDLTIISVPVALSEHNAAELIKSLSEEVTPVSIVSVGGDGALVIRSQFERSHIEVLEDFSALDQKLHVLLRQSMARG